MSSIFKQFSFLIVVVVILGGVYVVAKYTNVFREREEKVQNTDLWVQKVDDEVKKNLTKIQAITFDTGVLETEAYKSLKNTRVEIQDTEKGRNDLFAPAL